MLKEKENEDKSEMVSDSRNRKRNYQQNLVIKSRQNTISENLLCFDKKQH